MDRLEGMEMNRSDGQIAIDKDAPERETDIAIEAEELTDTENEQAVDGGSIRDGKEETDAPTDDGEVISEEENDPNPVDYERIMREDLIELKRAFSELEDITSIAELPNPMRYAALRDLGLTAKEAYLATSEIRKKDNRSHLSSAVPGGIGAPRCNMTRSELEGARELFPSLRDGELISLYKKVNL